MIPLAVTSRHTVVDKTTIENSVRRGEKVLKESAAAMDTSLDAVNRENKNVISIPISEDKMSEGDSGIGPESPELPGSGSEIDEVSSDTDDAESSETETPAESVYEVERIVDYSKEMSQYKVKWKDWHQDFNTWEPEANLANCEEELLRFFLERKKQNDEAEAEASYVTLPNGKRRRRGPPLKAMPPDPRPLQYRAQEFYINTQAPTDEEINECEALWKSFLTRKKNAWQWPMGQLDRILQDGIDGKLNFSQQKALREQLLVQQFDSRRQIVKQQLKNWEVEINVTTEGLPTIKVENEVDLAGPPQGFKYTNEYIPGPGIEIPDDPPVGCFCSDCFHNKQSCCANQAKTAFAYTHSRRLRVDIGTPIFECNKACQCGPECVNRVVQDGRSSLKDLQLCIYRTSNSCGWGVKTLRSIKKGTFVSLYVGEVITTDEADRRAKEYDAEGCTYLFDLDFNDDDNFPYAVDAAKCGNVAHFFNHSCDPNLAVFSVWVNCLDPNLPKLALFAIKDIPRGAQLTFDYMNQISNAGRFKGDDDDIKPARNRMPCLCGGANCRKYLFM